MQSNDRADASCGGTRRAEDVIEPFARRLREPPWLVGPYGPPQPVFRVPRTVFHLPSWTPRTSPSTMDHRRFHALDSPSPLGRPRAGRRLPAGGRRRPRHERAGAHHERRRRLRRRRGGHHQLLRHPRGAGLAGGRLRRPGRSGARRPAVGLLPRRRRSHYGRLQRLRGRHGAERRVGHGQPLLHRHPPAQPRGWRDRGRRRHGGRRDHHRRRGSQRRRRAGAGVPGPARRHLAGLWQRRSRHLHRRQRSLPARRRAGGGRRPGGRRDRSLGRTRGRLRHRQQHGRQPE